MWKLQDFIVIQILREIIFGEFRSSENAVSRYFRPLYFANLVKFSNEKVQKFIQFRASAYVKMAGFALTETTKLISRKI